VELWLAMFQVVRTVEAESPLERQYNTNLSVSFASMEQEFTVVKKIKGKSKGKI
jgi:hypothetical protein